MDKDRINKVLLNEASEQDAVEVAQWFGEADGQLMVSDLIDADMEEMVPHFDAPVCDVQMHVDNKVNRWWRAAAVVAIVLTLGVCAMWLAPQMHQPEVVLQTIYTNRGEQKQVVLQDGTHIYLNAGSQLSFPSQFTAKCREVKLVGEAYFEVQKDPHRPFVVDLNGVSVEVLGTKFDVKAYENELVQVNLDEGHVKLQVANQVTDLQPGERLVYDRQTSLTTHYHNADTHMASAWKEHRLEVSEMSMAELKNLLERRYDVTINVRDEQCYQYIYSLVVNDRNLHTILKRMSYVSPILYHYDEENGDVQIRAKH